MKKILIITGSRAEWGLLEPLYQKLKEEDHKHKIKILATGSHLSPQHGYTIKNINEDINKKYSHWSSELHASEIVLSSDSKVGIAKSMGLAAIDFGDFYQTIKPDLIILLGDRYEIFMAAAIANVFNIPVAHIHGGETTEGSYDDAFRNAITMMSTLHFPACAPYADNIYNMIYQDQDGGWEDEYCVDIHYFGTLGCEGLEKRKGRIKNFNQLLVVWHPVTNADEEELFDDLLEVLSGRNEHIIFIGSNADNGNTTILNKIEKWIYKHEAQLCSSLSRKEYLKVLSESTCIIGNSSSGIIEAPTLGVPTINIGTRQKGRLMADSIVQAYNKKGILTFFQWIDLAQTLIDSDYYCPYQGGNVAEKIANQIWRYLK